MSILTTTIQRTDLIEIPRKKNGQFVAGIRYSESTQFKKGTMTWNQGKKSTEETILKLRLSHLGQISGNKGKKHPFKDRPKAKGRAVWNKGIKVPQISGENSAFWKGGITPLHTKIRTSLEMRLWKKACFERDNYTCAKYGVRTGGLVVHHINNFSSFPELRTSISNGITLSKKAHVEFHNLYGYKDNTKEQLEEFLNNKNI